jgi:catechol-2,3-dioxygenase
LVQDPGSSDGSTWERPLTTWADDSTVRRIGEEGTMAQPIAAQGVHHFRLTVTDVDRAVRFYTEVLGFEKLMDLNPGAFLSNGKVGLGIGPHPFPDRAIAHDRFDENRVGLDHLSFGVASRADLDDAVRVLDHHRIAHSEIRDLGEAFGICILVFRDPDNVQLELSGPRK